MAFYCPYLKSGKNIEDGFLRELASGANCLGWEHKMKAEGRVKKLYNHVLMDTKKNEQQGGWGCKRKESSERVANRIY